MVISFITNIFRRIPCLKYPMFLFLSLDKEITLKNIYYILASFYFLSKNIKKIVIIYNLTTQNYIGHICMNDFTGKLTSLSKDSCALNRHGQYTTIERISAHESQQAEYVPHKTQPIVPDSESSNRSVNQAGNTTVHYDRNKNVNMAVSNREQYQSFSLDQDIVEDAVPESTDASIGKFISHVIHFLHFNLNIKIQKSWE